MKNIAERLKTEARILSLTCICEKRGCKECKRKKLMWGAANEIEKLLKHSGST